MAIRLERETGNGPKGKMQVIQNTRDTCRSTQILCQTRSAGGKDDGTLEPSVICVCFFLCGKTVRFHFLQDLNMAEMTHVRTQNKIGLWLGTYFESALLSGNI